jgi:hypothetical protein
MMELRKCLLAAKNANHRILKDCPQPIAGCDAQFQHFFDERGRIGKELAKLDDLSKLTDTGPAATQPIVSFLRSSDYIDSELAKRLTSAPVISV